MAEYLLEEQRENWGTRAGFILAAIGSAVGLGNLWGFPYKLYAYGGGAFLIPYIIAMLIIGIPVLILEFSLGHMTQRAAPNAFRRLGRWKEPIGWWGILLGFVIITYYPVILAWCLSFLYYSIKGIIYHGGELPWAGMGVEGVQKFFLFDYCNVWQGSEGTKPWALGTLSPEIVFCLVIVWVVMFLCIFRGVRMVSKVVMWTVPLPWLMLLILMIRGLTLDGAAQGLAYYLNPDWTQLTKPTTWRFAFGQVFFSMSLAFGVMVTYASFLHRKSDINNNAMIIGLGDLGTSFIAGIAVFATLGAMSVAAGVAVPEVITGKGTVGLAFIAFPYALGQLQGSAWFGAAFFIALLTLGIDSAFSITESVLASIVDKTGWTRTTTLWGMTFIGLICGLVYCSQGGITWLGNIDGFINGPWGIALLGLLECVVLGWMFRISRLREHANERSDWHLGPWWDWNIRIVVPIALSGLFVWSLYDTITDTDGYLFDNKGELIVPTLVCLILAAAAPLLALALSLIRSPIAARQQDSLPFANQAHRKDSSGKVGLVMALVALAITVVVIVMTMGLKLDMNAKGLKEVPLSRNAKDLFVYLMPALAAALAATVLGSIAVVRAEKQDTQPAVAARLSGGLGVLTLGAGGGISLALWVLIENIQSSAKTDAAAEMSAVAYVIIGVMLGLLIVGLAWCFYRAIKAAGAAEQQQNSEGAA